MRLRRRSGSDGTSGRLRRGLTIAGAAILVVLLGWVLFVYTVLLHPQISDPPHRADAIVVLGPSLGYRLNESIDLAHRLHIEQLLVSVGDTPGQIHDPRCTEPQQLVTITCFVPNPYTTRGEARELGTVAAQKHWRNVVVVAETTHLSRAHLLFTRCFSGTVQMVHDSTTFSATGEVRELVYQTLAYGKAVLQWGC